MAVECVGFHSNFGGVRQSGHSKTPLRLAIIYEFRSTQPTTLTGIVPRSRVKNFMLAIVLGNCIALRSLLELYRLR